jgi:hypothetical protein
MRLKIVDINYTGNFKWMYKLSNGAEDDFYIMQEDFYRYYGLKTPVSRQRLEYLDVGHWLSCNVEVIDGLKVVTNFI